MHIRAASEHDIPLISQLATEIWWPTYQSFISAEQISFMLDKMYSEDSLREQMEVEKVSFLIAERDIVPVAFAGFSMPKPGNFISKLHKLYLLPTEQGKGAGRQIINHIAELAAQAGGTILELNVNRSNPAYGFYLKNGFEVHQTIDIPYFHFVLNDYVMRKSLI